MITLGVLGAATPRAAGGGGGGGGGAYPPFANMVAGLHFDGADGSTTFTDVTGKIWTRVGTPTIVTAQSKFGGASGLFPGASYIEHNGGAAFAYGTGNFCWMGWVRLATTAGNQYFIDHNSNGGTLSYESNVLHYYNVATGASGALYHTATPLEINTWHFIEASRVSGTTYLFKNGVLIASQADPHNYPEATLRFGTFGGGGHTLQNAHLDDWSIYKGVGGHTANYTPPTAPFPDA